MANKLATVRALRKQLAPDPEGASRWVAKIEGIPLDAAHAFQLALKERFGEVVAHTETRLDPYGNERIIAPVVMEVDTKAGRVPVTWGAVKVSGYPFPIDVEVGMADGRFCAELSSYFHNEAQRKILNEVRERAEELIQTQSIYRGRAFKLMPRPDSHIAPDFMDLSGFSEQDLIFPEATQALLQQTLFYPLRHSDACRRRGVSLKRGLLLGGKWGTGKTLTARVAASIGTANGWTFIYCSTAEQLGMAAQMAASYQPALIFVEDVDEVMENRDGLSNHILNNLDGIASKGQELMVVLTTNYLDRVDPALLRPGRMDASIEMPLPDASTIERMIRHYAKGELPEQQPLDGVAGKLVGQIPAVIREAVERARLIAMTNDSERMTVLDLDAAVESMQDHMKRLDAQPRKDDSLETRVGRGIKELFIKGCREA